MAKRITIIQGNPDPTGEHFGRALAQAYARGAEAAGHEVKLIEVAGLDFPWLRSKSEWEQATTTPGAIRDAQAAIAWADHLFIVYPLWLGAMPAVLKGFFEQALRPGFALGEPRANRLPAKLLKGRSARIVITMGMPGFVYRWYFGAHSLKNLRRNILGFCGIGPVRSSLVGMVGGSARRRDKWLRKMQGFGSRAV